MTAAYLRQNLGLPPDSLSYLAGLCQQNRIEEKEVTDALTGIA